MAKRKRATRAQPSSNTLSLPALKPRNTVLLAAAQGRVKLATTSHQKSQGAKRRADKLAVRKAVDGLGES